MSEFKTSIGKRRNPAGTTPLKNYTIPDGASIPSEYIANPSEEILKESFFMKNNPVVTNTTFESTNNGPMNFSGSSLPPTPYGPGQLPPGFPMPPSQPQQMFPQMNPAITYQDYQQQMAQQQQQFQQQKIQQKLDDVTRKLDLLLKSTILKKDIEITNDLIFSIRNLSNEQQVKAVMKGAEAKFRVEESLIMRDWLVAQSIDTVSGMKITDIFGEDTIEMRMFFVKKLDDKIVSRLHQEVILFQEECEKQYGVRTQAEFDKLIEAIKKA